MRAAIIALTLPAALAVVLSGSSADAGAQVPFPLNPAASTYSSPHDHERYDGEFVQRFNLEGLSRDRRDMLVNVLNSFNLDIWRVSNTSLDVRAPRRLWKAVLSALPGQWDVKTMIADLQQLVEGAQPKRRSTNPEDRPDGTSDLMEPVWDVNDLGTPFHDEYRSFDDMLLFGSALVEAFPDLVSQKDLGSTQEGRPIRAWSIRAGRTDDDKLPRYEFIVQSGQHAREWVGSSSALYLLHAITLAANNEPKGKWKELLRSYTFTIVPVVNPDGYVYSQEHSRLWKKNRQEVGGLVCKGIDLNTNWGYQFTPSRLACSDSYSGQEPFEALETRAMGNYVQNGTAEGRDYPVKAFIDVHSYGQLFMFPFAYSCEDFPADAENLMEAGLGAAKAMRMRQGEAYQTGQACDLTYRATGDAMDFAYATAEVRWTYSLEMRDTGTYGFLLPPHLIRPTAEELAAGLKALAWFIFDTEIDP